MASSLLRRATLPAAALLVGSAFAAAHADGQAGRTMVLTSPAPTARDVRQGDFKQVDLAPRGVSPGDYFLAAGGCARTGTWWRAGTRRAP
jgi:hypothetical protein